MRSYRRRMGVWREIAAQWMRIMTITADKSLSMSEQAQLIAEVNGPVQLNVKLRPYRWPWQRSLAKEVMDASGVAALTAINWQLNTARVATEHLVDRLSKATGESREEIMQELSLSIDAKIAAAEEAAGEK